MLCDLIKYVNLGNLNTVGTTENISTSDEDMPTAPPRNRSHENGAPLATPRRYLNNKEKSRGKYNIRHFSIELLINFHRQLL